MKRKLFVCLLLAGFTGGCAATITPRGEIYTEALFPTAVVVEHSYHRAVVPPPHRPVARHFGPIVSRHRYGGGGPGHHGHTRPGPKGPIRR